ncbi:calcium-binding protein [Shimia ponticola]|uniref:calcium-binding protein n=1 Tax=Shimia ponticola TaxID=2582893 RepID=UPI0011BEE2A3|nr:calcium-binding protein [Shimia ponticola]
MQFSIVGTMTSGLLGQHHTTAEMWYDGSALVVQNLLGGGTTTLSVTSDAAARVVTQVETTATQMTDARWFSGTSLSVARSDLDVVSAVETSQSLTIYAEQSGEFSDAIEALAISVGNRDFIVMAQPTGGGLACYSYDGTHLTRENAQWDKPDSYMSGISALSTARMGNQTYVIAAGANDNGIAVLHLSSNGDITPISAIGYDQFLPVYTVTSVDVVQSGTETFVLVTASDTSSLTVLRLSHDGTLTPVDQIMDDRTTCMEGTAVMESFSHGERVYVLVAGQDDGLSLFTLMPDGRLIHVESIADTTDAGLSNINNIEVVQTEDTFQVFVTSTQENGITQLELDLGPPGVIAEHVGTLTAGAGHDILVADDSGATLDGGWGDDILVDGAGLDTLTGGGGADLFVIGADGHRDIITDFDLAEDRLDLSAWGYLRDISQLTITSRNDGAVIAFGAHSLRLFSADGQSLDPDAWTTAHVLNATHVDLSYVGATYAFTGDEITGTDASETLAGGDDRQTIRGRDGNDVLIGGEGADRLDGGAGHDEASYAPAGSAVFVSLLNPETNTGQAEGDSFVSIEGLIGSAFGDELIGDNAANTLDGGDGDDVLRGLTGADTLYGRDGDDWLDGGDGHDVIRGGDGNDAVLGRDGNDRLYGEAGDDNIAAHDGDDQVYGGDGNDLLGGSFGNDTMYGGNGNDIIGSGPDDDFIFAGNGDDVASGGWGTDQVEGGAGDDTLAGSYGNDIVRGGAGNDSLGGGTGTDELYGDAGDDLLGAGDDDDRLYGGTGNDFLGGGAGNDRMYGGTGQDTLNGGDGNDTLYGGAEGDIFVFNSFTQGERDIIRDFTLGEDALRMKYVVGRFDGLDISDVTIGGNHYAQITYRGHDILLQDVMADDLDVSDFIFLG